jgi:diguanylate cyclase (GGDEF)-like protein
LVRRTGSNETEHRHGFVLMFDVQRLILVNDALGHLAGDDLVLAVADRLLSAVPVGAVVGRLSGEEYAVHALCESLDEAEGLAASVVSAVESPVLVRTHVRNGGEAVVVPITPRMSWGVSDCSRVEYADARDCLLAADDDRMRRSTPGRPSMEQCRRAIAEESGVVF